MTIGNISSFLLYMIMLIFDFALLSMVFGNVMKTIGASEKIIQIMKYIPTVNSKGGIKIPEQDVVGEIELKNVSFTYPTKKEVEVCKNISLKIERNKVVALVGQSGCGKSSIISLIERFYDPAQGEVLFSGVNIKDLDPKWYKS